MSADIILDLQIATEEHQNVPSEKEFYHWATQTILLFYEKAEITIRIVTPDESQQLNSQYRHKDKPTNVLSFPFESPLEMDIPLLGDLVICQQVVEQEAQEQHKPVLAHWAHMVVHGILHLLGYDHLVEQEAQQMESLEIEMLQTLGFANPYLLN